MDFKKELDKTCRLYFMSGFCFGVACAIATYTIIRILQ